VDFTTCSTCNGGMKKSSNTNASRLNHICLAHHSKSKNEISYCQLFQQPFNKTHTISRFKAIFWILRGHSCQTVVEEEQLLQFHRMWKMFSSSLRQQGHKGFWTIFFENKLTLVGSILTPAKSVSLLHCRRLFFGFFLPLCLCIPFVTMYSLPIYDSNFIKIFIVRELKCNSSKICDFV
jgi:hypothetical protein